MAFPPCEDTVGSQQPEAGPHQTCWHPDLGPNPSSAISNTFLLLISQSVCGVSLQQLEQTKMRCQVIGDLPHSFSQLHPGQHGSGGSRPAEEGRGRGLALYF